MSDLDRDGKYNVRHFVHLADFESAPVVLTREQREIVDQAIDRMRVRYDLYYGAENPTLSEGRAIELICADFLAGEEPADE